MIDTLSDLKCIQFKMQLIFIRANGFTRVQYYNLLSFCFAMG